MLADTPLPRGFGAALASVDTFFPRAPEQFVTSPLCLVGYVRWDARSDRVPPLQTIIFSSFPGRTKVCRQSAHNRMHCMFPRTTAAPGWSIATAPAPQEPYPYQADCGEGVKGALLGSLDKGEMQP